MSARPATAEEKLRTIQRLLKSMPFPKVAADAPTPIADYAVALDGVSAEALELACRDALQGRHGSHFMPWPAQLRRLCDVYAIAANPFRSPPRRADDDPVGPQQIRTPEEVERQLERMRRFHEANAQAKAEVELRDTNPELAALIEEQMFPASQRMGRSSEQTFREWNARRALQGLEPVQPVQRSHAGLTIEHSAAERRGSGSDGSSSGSSEEGG